jgi:hypothetical protein
MTLPLSLLFMCLVADPIVAAWLDRDHVQLVERGDLSAETAKVAPAHPGIVVGKFRALDKASAGLIRKAGGRVRFQIIACSSKDDCAIQVDEDVSDYGRIVFLEKVPKGTTVSTDDSAEVQQQHALTGEGVKITYFGKGAVVHYWNAATKKWESIGVSD